MGCCESIKLYSWDKPTWNNTSQYVPDIKYGRVIKVYDGDTFTIAFRTSYFGHIQRHSVRIADIDAPEMRGEDKESGIRSRDFLRELILDKIVRVKIVKLDNFGRFLAHVYIHNIYINQHLIKNNYAKIYNK